MAPVQLSAGLGWVYLAPHEACPQLGDVGVCAGQARQVGPLVLKLVVEHGQQLPGQVVVPRGPGRDGGFSGWTCGPGASWPTPWHAVLWFSQAQDYRGGRLPLTWAHLSLGELLNCPTPGNRPGNN